MQQCHKIFVSIENFSWIGIGPNSALKLCSVSDEFSSITRQINYCFYAHAPHDSFICTFIQNKNRVNFRTLKKHSLTSL
jgi:hypothetical protein